MTPLEHVADIWRSFARDLPAAIHPRFTFADLLTRWMPPFASGFFRGPLYRSVGGVDLGQGVFVMGRMRVIGGTRGHMANIHIGDRALISTDVVLNPDAPIHLGDDVTLGPFCRIYTSTHEMGPSEHRCSPVSVNRPVHIGRGAWLAIGVTVLPGVTIGAGAVIASGSVVASDVEPNTFAGGVPARPIRPLDP